MKLMESEGNTPAITKTSSKEVSFPVEKFQVLPSLHESLSNKLQLIAFVFVNSLMMFTLIDTEKLQWD